VIGDMHVGTSLRHDVAETLRRRCIGLEAPWTTSHTDRLHTLAPMLALR
jgi:hypothetical protein